MDQRRFLRVKVPLGLAEAISLLGAIIVWPNHETSPVNDLSYKGFAVRRPGLQPLAVQQRIPVQVELSNLPAFNAEVRIAWQNLDSVGLEVTNLSSAGHAAMHRYLEAKLVGAQLRAVERALIARQHTFQYWFQGPSDTHVFIWLAASQEIQKVSVLHGEQSIDLERGGYVKATAGWRRAILLLSQIDNPDIHMEEFLRTLKGEELGFGK